MAKFKITPTTTVAELKEQFRNEIGGVLRVYEGRSQAPADATLVSLGAKEGELECRTSRTVGKFEEAFQKDLNLKVKVYTKDENVSVLDGITLATVKEIPNMSTHAKMEKYLSYKRDEKVEEEEVVNEEEIEEKEDVQPLPNPNAIYFVINSEPRAVEDEDNDWETYEDGGFIAFRAIVDSQYLYGVWKQPVEELAEELGIDIYDIEVYDMYNAYDSVENYPSEKNVYLPNWLYELYTSSDSNIAELCPDEDSEPIIAAIDCCLTDHSPNWVFDEEVPCMIVKSNGNIGKSWLAKNTK